MLVHGVQLPFNGKYSGGTGVEVSAVIEAPNVEVAKRNWLKLTKTLSGFFCASLNFIDDHITTYPKHAVKEINLAEYAPERVINCICYVLHYPVNQFVQKI